RRPLTVLLSAPSLARPRRPPPFPYTTLFRSVRPGRDRGGRVPAGGTSSVRGTHHPSPTRRPGAAPVVGGDAPARAPRRRPRGRADRKSTRLNSSHVKISYAVFCVKKKTQRAC